MLTQETQAAYDIQRAAEEARTAERLYHAAIEDRDAAIMRGIAVGLSERQCASAAGVERGIIWKVKQKAAKSNVA